MAGHEQLKFVMRECSKTQIHLTGSHVILFFQAYKIDVFQSGRFHSIDKRYSEFEELHKQVSLVDK